MNKASRYASLVMAAIAIICGFMLVFDPAGFANGICRVIGIICLLVGAMRTVDSYNTRTPVTLGGIVTLAAGVLLVFMPALVLRFISVIAGVTLIACCLPRFKNALDARKLGTNRWEQNLIISSAAMVLGALLIIGGASIAHIIVRILGAALIIIGAFAILSFIRPKQ